MRRGVSGRAIGIAHTWANIELIIEEKPTDEQSNHIFDIMKEAVEQAFCVGEDSEVEEVNYRQVEDYSDSTYQFFMDYGIEVIIEGSGWYEPAFISGPSEDCYPADGDAEFDIPTVNKKFIDNYIKDYFEKYEPVKNLTLVDIDVSCGDLEEPDDYEIEEYDNSDEEYDRWRDERW